MSYLGNFAASATLDLKFTTRRFTTGVPFALATGTISVYKNNDVTQSTTGVTLTADFDGVAGLNNVRIDTSADGTFYASGSNFQVVITAGTVDSVSVVGEVVGQFSIGTARVDNVTYWLSTAAATPTVAGVPEVDVTHWLGTAAATPTVAGVPEVDVTHFNGTAGTFSAGRPEVNTTHAAGTAWGSGAITAASIATDAITAAKIATDAIGASELAADAVTEIQAGLSTVTTAQVNAEVVDALATDTYVEPGQGAPAATTTLAAKINYIYKFLRNKHTQTATQFSLYADDTTTIDQKATVSDDGTTFTRGEVATGP